MSLPTTSSIFGKPIKERVCKDCSVTLTQYKSVQKWFNIFNLIGLDMKDILILGQVHRKWHRVSFYYTKIFRNIQYRIPDSLNSVESIMLKNNASLLSGHSVWIVQLCKLLHTNVDHQGIVKACLKRKGEKIRK